MNLDYLVIAPHPDDAELGMAGAILKFKAEGRKVGVLDLTSGEPTPHGSL
jgi:N-acetylglucosamine malate deacetylase 1